MIQGTTPVRLPAPPPGRQVTLAPGRVVAVTAVMPSLTPVYRPADCTKGLLVDRWA